MENSIRTLAGELGRRAEASGVIAATAESCTAGGISFAITSVPGSSAWFDRGFVTYTNEAKHEMLGVPEEELREFGAVSEPVVKSMALGALQNSRATIAAAVSGIAGPGGAVPGKPVGTVCFGFASRRGGAERVLSCTCLFRGDRTSIREQTIAKALQGLIKLTNSARTGP